jgi:pyrroloquinoline-quinone synthase
MDLNLESLKSAQATLVERMRAHPFLARCRAGTVELDEMKLFLVQHGLYSGYFTRYLCAMMANLPGHSEVLALARNLFEELGLAPCSPRPHYQVYRETLQYFGLGLEEAKPLPGTRRLIDTMFVHCRAAMPARGLGALCLGAEALVPAVYADLLAGFAGCGVPPEPLEFFRMHVTPGDGPRPALWDLLARVAGEDPAQVLQTLRAGRDLVEARLGFFSSIETAHRRASQPLLVDLTLPRRWGSEVVELA